MSQSIREKSTPLELASLKSLAAFHNTQTGTHPYVPAFTLTPTSTINPHRKTENQSHPRQIEKTWELEITSLSKCSWVHSYKSMLTCSHLRGPVCRRHQATNQQKALISPETKLFSFHYSYITDTYIFLYRKKTSRFLDKAKPVTSVKYRPWCGKITLCFVLN